MRRKISLAVIGLAIVLIPTFIMLSFYLSNRSIPVEIRNTEEIIMVTPDEKTVKLKVGGQDEKDDQLLKLICELTLDAKSVEKLPEEAEQSQMYKVTFRTKDSSLVYEFYFGQNPAYCYFVTESKEVWRIATEKAQEFLNCEYSEPIYTYAEAPTVTLNGRVLIPNTLDWEYRLLNGAYRKASCSVKDQKVVPPDLGILDKPLQIESTLPADNCIVNAHDEKGNLLYSGDGQGLEAIAVEDDTEIILTFILEWKKDETGKAPFAGKAEYTAKAAKYPPAEFEISTETVYAGQTFLIKGIHVSDPAGVQMTISPEVDFEVKFVCDGQKMKALMTLGMSDTPETDCEYVITLTSQEWDAPVSFTVTQKGKEYGSFRDYVSKEVIGQTFTLSQKNAFLECMREIMSQPTTYSTQDGKMLFGEAVLTPDASRSYQYGDSIFIHQTKSQYQALDTMYGVYSASKPIAVADGKVLFVGETALTGKMVVIDHGQGVRSWYCNLSEVTVTAGQVLQKGDVIGKCLGGGFNGQSGVNMHVALTLENVALDLKWAIENGIEY